MMHMYTKPVEKSRKGIEKFKVSPQLHIKFEVSLHYVKPCFNRTKTIHLKIKKQYRHGGEDL